MKKIFKKPFALILSVLLILGGCGSAPEDKPDKPTKKNPTEAGTIVSTDPAGSAGASEEDTQANPGYIIDPSVLSTATGILSEQEYVDRHLNFLTGRIYMEAKKGKGGVAYEISQNYYDSAQSLVNGFWEHFSECSLLLANGSYEFKDEYAILVGSVLQSTAMQKNFEEKYDENLMLQVQHVLEGIRDTLGNTKELVSLVNPGKIEKCDKIAANLDKILNTLVSKLSKTKDKNTAINLYQDAWNEAKVELGVAFEPGDTEFLKTVLGGLGVACEFADFTASTYTEFMDEYVLLTTCDLANTEYRNVWNSITSELLKMENPEVKKIGIALSNQLQEMERAQTDFDKIMREKLYKTAGGNLFKIGLGHASGVFDDMLKAYPILAGIRAGLGNGVALANCVTGMDNIAFCGKMYMGAGFMAYAAYQALESYQYALENDPNFTSAVNFDQCYNTYLDIQNATYEYGIQYCDAVLEAPAHLLAKNAEQNPNLVAKHILEKEINNNLPLSCHEHAVNDKITVIKDVVYYMKETSASYDKTALLGNFYDKTIEKQFSVLKDDKEIPLTTLKKDGDIVYFDGYFYVNTNDNSIIQYKPSGDSVANHSNRTLVTVDETAHTMIYYDQSQDKMFAEKSTGANSKEICNLKLSYIGTHDGVAFFKHFEKNEVSFYSFDFNDSKAKLLAAYTIKNYETNYSVATTGDPMFAEDCFYIAIGTYQGTGKVFNKGSIIAVKYIGGYDTIASENDPNYSLGYISTFYMTGKSGKHYVYFSHSGDFTSGGYWPNSYMKKGVMRYCVETGTIEEDPNFIISGLGQMIYNDNSIQMKLSEDGKFTTLLTKDQAETDLKYEKFGTGSYSPWSIVVGDYAYICLRNVKRNPSKDLGWREAYDLIKQGLYRIKISGDTKDYLRIYEFRN